MFTCVEPKIVEDPPPWVKTFDNISGAFFSVGFVLNRIKDLPLGQLSKILTTSAMSGFAFANGLQLISSRFYHTDGDKTYANLITLSSLIGVIACTAILLQPQSWLIWTWLFVLGNSIWYHAECHRYQQPSTYPKLKYEAKSYLNYVQMLVIASISSSVFYTLMYCLPALAGPLFYIGLALNYMASISAFMQLQPIEDESARKNI